MGGRLGSWSGIFGVSDTAPTGDTYNRLVETILRKAPDRSLPTHPSNLMNPPISQRDEYCGGESNSSLVHDLSRPNTVPPLSELDATTSGIVQVIKEYLNEMPYWKNHWEPPNVNQDFAECIYDELVAKNWDVSPQNLKITVHLIAALIEVKYYLPTAFIC